MEKRVWMAVVAAVLMVFGMAGLCGVPSASAAETTRLSIVTAGTGGVFYVYGGAVASVVSKNVPGLNMTAESTGGSVENMKILAKKQADLATTSADVLYQAFHDFKNSKHFKEKVDVRALFNMYSQPHHLMALAKSDVKTVKDLKGKRVVVGSPGSGTEVKTKMLLQALGITYKDFTPEFLSFTEGAEALQDGTVAAAFLGVSYPAPAVVSLALTTPIRLIPFSDAEIATISKAYPFLSKSIIPGKTYKGVDQDTQTISVQTLVVCRADLSDDIAYKIVKTVFDRKKDLDQIHSAFRETTLEDATSTIVPLHPGAVKFYKEKKIIK
ncbi:MAG: NMT1/THI5 like protein [Syntrophaceae bacterium PtaU1.Bin231]|nr:MAG: NMT1/THI5 like protein [Syntrophaceae bacterium PtaU1.Bin231]HOG18593.1 TAXI family TRAP transporter solute-binding subunit [Syntrophales bacterium]